MADDRFVLGIEIDAAQALQMVNTLTRSIRETGQAIGLTDKQIEGMEKGLAKTGAATKTAASNQKDLHQSLSTTRYALYDVSNTLGVAGIALLGLATAAYKVGIAWERDFANVVRTTSANLGAEQIDRMRDAFIDLQGTLPVTSRDLAEIGTLAGQLGIAAGDVVNFTEQVAKFSAVSGVSVDASATAFGRLDSLLPDVRGNFEGLSSSILKVGVNSVATEAQIISTAQQIASMGELAGLSADEVIGLSGAMASLGISPELARSVITSSFTKIITAVTEGGVALEKFGAASGQSGQEFKESWNEDAVGTYSRLLATISSSDNAIGMLQDLGLHSQRLTPTLLKLGQNTDILAQSLSDAGVGFSEASEVNRQYGLIAETTASKIQILVNKFQGFIATLVDGGTVLGGAIDAISGLLTMLTDFSREPMGANILQFGVIAAGVVGAMLILAAAASRLVAGGIALRQAWAGMAPLFASTGTAATGAAAGLSATSVAAGGTSRVLANLVKTAGPVVAIFAALQVIDWAANFRESVNDVDGYINSLKTAGDATKTFFEFGETDTGFGDVLSGYSDDISKFNKDLEDIGQSDFWGDFAQKTNNVAPLRDATGAIDNFRDTFRKLQEQGEESFGIQAFQEIVHGANLSDDALAALLSRAPEVKGAMTDMLTGLDIEATDQTLMDLARGTLPATQQAAVDAATGFDALAMDIASAEEALKSATATLLEFNGTAISAEQAEINFQGALSSVVEAAKEATVTVDGTNEASLRFRQTLLDAESAARSSAQAIVDNGGDVDVAAGKYRSMRTAIVDQITALGYSRGVAEQWADTVLGTTSEAEGAIRNYSTAVKNVPKTATTEVRANTGPAYSDVNDLVAQMRKIRITIPVNAATSYAVNSGSAGGIPRATGGPVYGPGTSTSDSIQAWLSNGEFVMKTQAVQRYGLGYMHAINSGRAPKFAQGGPVGAAPASSMSGITELGPKTLARLTREITNNIYLDDVTIAQAANRGNTNLRNMGR